MNTLSDIARQVVQDLVRMDTLMRDSHLKTFDEAGGFAGWSVTGKRLYLKANGRRVLSQDDAVRSWAEA